MKKADKKRDEILMRIIYAKDFTPHKINYYQRMLIEYDKLTIITNKN